MPTLHEMANKLQDSIIKQQEDAHNSSTLNVSKYNNLKLKMHSKYNYPHVIVCIGISEAVFNIKDLTKTDGGLGPDEKYVRKWLARSTVAYDLNEIYISMDELISAKEMAAKEKEEIQEQVVKQEGEAGDVKVDNPRGNKRKKRLVSLDEQVKNSKTTVHDDIELDKRLDNHSNDEDYNYDYEEVEKKRTTSSAATTESTNKSNSESETEIKEDLKAYLNSSFRFRKKEN